MDKLHTFDMRLLDAYKFLVLEIGWVVEKPEVPTKTMRIVNHDDFAMAMVAVYSVRCIVLFKVKALAVDHLKLPNDVKN